MLKPGLYEQVINKEIKRELLSIEASKSYHKPLDQAESHKVLTHYLSEIIESALSQIAVSEKKDPSLKKQIELANSIVALIREKTSDDRLLELEVHEDAEELLMLLGEKDPLLKAMDVTRPETSVMRTSLFTGATDEPQLYSELAKELKTCDRFDMLVAFITYGGIRLLMDELIAFTARGGEIRIITTSYMGHTELKAIVELERLPNTTIKFSYDTRVTRLHAKTYLFHRDSGFSTAYVGSSNFSRPAMTTGLEWNVKIAKKELPETFNKMVGTFESYWNSTDFEYYRESDQERLERALKKKSTQAPFLELDLRPFSFQQEILDHLEAERSIHSHYKNLIVAATGTGKTMIAAFDYRRFKVKRNPGPARLLFIAHRKEILEQSLHTYRVVLKDANFGDLFVGTHSSTSLDHAFMSIQTFNSMDLPSLVSPDYYDYIVIDEFHHAAAPSYQKLLDYFNPTILLGLTATPERMDGKDIFVYFDHRIAAEIRLPEAIERQLLCPFQYFGVSDEVDLSGLKWGIGGYDVSELSGLYTFSGAVAQKRADLIVRSLLKYTADMGTLKGLGFCVSVDHATFMADHFNKRGIASIALSATSSEEDRDSAAKKLRMGEINMIFVVDLYNEGIDIPEINTVLFLRPTASLTVFLQQLGRGLRIAPDKDYLTVLDFIGQAHKKYRFEEKFKALQLNRRQGISQALKEGFKGLPRGSYIHLEKMAQEYILKNIRASLGNRRDLVNKAEVFQEETGKILSLKNFLDYYHLDPKQLYRYMSFSELKVAAGLMESFDEPMEEILRKALLRMTSMDSRRLIQFLLEYLPNIEERSLESLSSMETTMLHMFYVSIWGETLDLRAPEVKNNLLALSRSLVLLTEMMELLEYQYEQIDFIDEPVLKDVPLDLHCSYSKDQILVAMDFFKTSAMREGVKWLEKKQVDLLFVTLNKSDNDYSPTTMYEDYSINETLFHWQSQSTTSEHSPTGLRYQHHKREGSKVLFFVRENKKDTLTGLAEHYTFLGLADYVSHEGSKPMSITWRLHRPIAAKLLKKTNKLAVS